MDFLTWKNSIIEDVERLGTRPTARKYRLSISSLQNLLSGPQYAGLQTWKRVGALVRPEDLKDPVKIKAPR